MRRLFILALVATQLLACTSLRPTNKESLPVLTAENDLKVLASNDWRLVGRLSVRNSKESWLTKLDWQHDVLLDDLTLSTSLGGVAARLTYANGYIILTDSDGVRRRVMEPDLQQQIGYSPPLNHLKYWIRGVPDPMLTVQDYQLTEANEKSFEQNGWLLKISQFEVFGDVVLPRKVFLSKNNIKIKVVVDEWLK